MWGTELLTIKLALEEWRHWLEGAHPVLVLTDHRHLDYIRGAKRLISRQARLSSHASIFMLLTSLERKTLPSV
jgi:hypothetical protein